MDQHAAVQFEVQGAYQNKWYQVTVYPSVEGISVYWQDITERKQAEEQLAYHASLLDNLHEAVIATDTEQHITAWNKAAEAMYGFTEKEVLEKTPGEVLRTEFTDDQRALILKQLEETGRYTIEVAQYKKDGQRIIVEGSAIPHFDSQGKIIGYVTANRDITERKQAEETARENRIQMEIQRRLLEYREQERQKLARDLHDGPIQDLSSLLFQIGYTKEAVTDPEVQAEVDQISNRLRSTIKSLREMMTDLRPLSLIRFGLSKTLQVYIEEFREKHPWIELETTFVDDGNLLSEQARLSLFRIFQEALTNVTKHANASKVLVQLNTIDHHIMLEVRDDGKGFSLQNDLVDYSNNGHYGLVGMKEWVEAIGGELKVSTEPGQGTSVQAFIPLKQENG